MASNKEYGKEAVRIKELEAKAKKGDDKAQMDLLYNIINGYNNGDDKNIEKTIEWGEKSAEQGDTYFANFGFLLRVEDKQARLEEIYKELYEIK